MHVKGETSKINQKIDENKFSLNVHNDQRVGIIYAIFTSELISPAYICM